VTASEAKVVAQLSAVPGRCMVECCVPWMCVWVDIQQWIISVDIITFQRHFSNLKM